MARCKKFPKLCSPNISPIRESPDEPKIYVQDLLRKQEAALGPLLRQDETHIYVCGLRGMERGVQEAFDDVCRSGGLNWTQLRDAMREQGRYHVETY